MIRRRNFLPQQEASQHSVHPTPPALGIAHEVDCQDLIADILAKRKKMEDWEKLSAK
jgi:hypothetical protein